MYFSLWIYWFSNRVQNQNGWTNLYTARTQASVGFCLVPHVIPHQGWIGSRQRTILIALEKKKKLGPNYRYGSSKQKTKKGKEKKSSAKQTFLFSYSKKKTPYCGSDKRHTTL